MESDKNWKRNAMFVGGVIGALVGVIAANMLVKEAEENENEKALTPARGMQIGMLVLGLLRQITNL
jgi:hypothetical protein